MLTTNMPEHVPRQPIDEHYPGIRASATSAKVVIASDTDLAGANPTAAAKRARQRDGPQTCAQRFMSNAEVDLN